MERVSRKKAATLPLRHLRGRWSLFYGSVYLFIFLQCQDHCLNEEDGEPERRQQRDERWWIALLVGGFVALTQVVGFI